MAGHDGDDGYFSAPGLYFFRADDGVFVVVAAFDDDVRAGGYDQLERGGLAEDSYGVNGCERGEDAGAGVFADDRATGPFEGGNRVVRVDGDDEPVA